MINLTPELLAIIMLGGVLVGVLTGFPLAIVIGALTLFVGYAVFGERVGELLYQRMFSGILMNYTLLAIPMFIFMGIMLERSGIAERLYDALYLWLGGIRGGLAVITILLGTILAACVGIIAASVSMLAQVALPSMVRRGYSKALASGSVCAGGTLGILIPPSIMLLIYGPMAGLSVGKLFFGAFMPGFLLSALYMTYIVVHCLFHPENGPPVSPEERAVPFLKKTRMLISALVPTAIVVMSVLGVIYLGIAAPTEAAGAGALATTLLVIIYRRFSWQVLKEVTLETLRLSGFIFLIVAMAFVFVGVFLGAKSGDVVGDLILATPGGKWGVFGVIMFIVFILGLFLDWLPIIFIIVPIATPIAAALGFDPIWFAIMVCVDLQTCFMTPPFAGAIFILKGSASPELGVTMADIIRGVSPFVLLVLIGLALLVAFPGIILWLPGQMIR